MRLSDAERKIVVDCMHESADANLYDEWEFSTIMGLTRDEMRAEADAWRVQQPGVNLDAAINALNNLLGYPHSDRQRAAVFERIGTDGDVVRRVLARLLAAKKAGA